jgi:UDP-GlcNAc:undecaprenyl-phosphate GlcNAc-1-phosphate transferase
MIALVYLVAITGFIFTCGLCIFLTHWIRIQALEKGALDQPNARSMHVNPIPRLGGLAIALSFYFGLFFYQLIERWVPSMSFYINFPSYSVLLGSFIMLLTGVFDDLQGLNARQKLILQSVAALVMILGGFQFRFANFIEFLTGWNVFWIDYPITFLWIIAVINSFNLIDGLDGLAAGTAVIVVCSLALATALNGYGADLVFITCFIGPLIGFLVFNKPPASIFMGDSGSLFLGFLLATFALPVTENVKFQFSFLIPMLALGLPLLDTTTSVVRRVSQSRHPFAPDRDHIHHRVFSLAGGKKGLAIRNLYAISLVFGFFCILISTIDNLKTLGIALGVLFLVCLILVFRLGYFGKAADKNAEDDQDQKPQGAS